MKSNGTSRLPLVVILSLSGFITGCIHSAAKSGSQDQMGSRKAVAKARFPPTVTTGADGRAYVRVYYATDRRANPVATIRAEYGGTQNATGGLDYGSAVISIPPGHHMGGLEQPSFWVLQFSENPDKHIVISSASRQSSSDFFNDVSASVAKSTEKDAFVFVHGYRVTFDEAIMQTGQIAYDLNFSGAPIVYSWPSTGTLEGYTADEDSIRWTVDHLSEFLKEVSERSHARSIHLIAHSMGNRALLDALKQLSDRHEQAHFKELVMAAPDISVSEFRQDIPRVTNMVSQITLYASSKDEALILSHKVNQYQRAGDTNGGVTIVPPVETIDASHVDTGIIGHSYFSGPTVLGDIYYLLKFGNAPKDRTRLRSVTSNGKTYWAFVPAVHWWLW